MLESTDKPGNAFQELVRVLEGAIQAGVNTIGLEYKGRELMVFHYVGIMGLGATRIAQDLRQAVLGEIIERAKLSRKPKGKMQLKLLGHDYKVAVEEYDDFGESAFRLTLKEGKKKRS